MGLVHAAHADRVEVDALRRSSPAGSAGSSAALRRAALRQAALRHRAGHRDGTQGETARRRARAVQRGHLAVRVSGNDSCGPAVKLVRVNFCARLAEVVKALGAAASRRSGAAPRETGCRTRTPGPPPLAPLPFWSISSGRVTGQVRADPGERLEHLILSLVEAVAQRGDRDHQADAQAEPERREEGAALAAAQLGADVPRKNMARASAARLRAAGGPHKSC